MTIEPSLVFILMGFVAAIVSTMLRSSLPRKASLWRNGDHISLICANTSLAVCIIAFATSCVLILLHR